MQLVLDTNEYLFNFGLQEKQSCRALLELIVSNPEQYRVRLSRTIIEEVQRNVPPQGLRAFWTLIEILGISVDESWAIPFELGARYEAMGLKQGDAFIAAYAEWAGAQYLISENRDFLALQNLPFKIVRAEQFLARHK